LFHPSATLLVRCLQPATYYRPTSGRRSRAGPRCLLERQYATKPFRCVPATVAELPDRRAYPEQAEFVVRLISPRLSKTLYFPPRRLRKVIETPADATSVVSPNTWQFAAMAADSKSTTTIDGSGTTVLHGVAFGEPKNVN